ncbi:MAG: pyridoxal-phosphate dependent enzyme [Wenzhouxiangellaceae bacterium]|nr:pyridoxal-phosphate dependent enzyme [Wenzhouxiangellaceae bacterium]
MIATRARAFSPAEALAVIARSIERTPIMRSDALNQTFGLELYFKCEQLQTTGSFKFRGASFAVSQLPDDCPGVATHSSGNHGAALAAAARSQGLSADVVMPQNAVPTKIESVRSFGGVVHFCRPTQAAREQGLARLVEQGKVAIPPYDHEHVIAGQGTVAVELMAQQPGLDVIIAPIGGGGLLAGITLAAHQHAPGTTVFGAEPARADDAARSLRAGRRVSEHRPETIADGLRALIGARNFEILNRNQVEILTVTEAQIRDAMIQVWSHLKQVVEPSGAVALAAVLAHRKRFAGRRIGVVLSGGNLNVASLLECLEPAA